MMSDSMACDDKTDRASWNFTRKNSNSQTSRTTWSDSDLTDSDRECHDQTPRVVVDAFNFRDALLVTFLPNNDDE